MQRPITLGEFIIEHQDDFPYAKGEFSALMSCLMVAGKVVNEKINKAGLANILGKIEEENVQGEIQARLDVLANKVFIQTLKNRGEICGMASEEIESYISFNDPMNKDANYIVLIDPLDGSSNIDVGVTVGTIFSVYRRVSPTGEPVEMRDFLQPGVEQIIAGYILYGTSTIFVYTSGNGVNGFTFDPGVGSFFLSHPAMTFPKMGKIYSINEGNYEHFPKGIKKFIKWSQKKDQQDYRPLSLRYTGSLVADFHRNLLLGGIFLYPTGTMAPRGKLRLLYECNPIAFIAEQAGGMATTGSQRILELQPQELHQRVPFICGTKGMVERVEDFISSER